MTRSGPLLHLSKCIKWKWLESRRELVFKLLRLYLSLVICHCLNLPIPWNIWRTQAQVLDFHVFVFNLSDPRGHWLWWYCLFCWLVVMYMYLFVYITILISQINELAYFWNCRIHEIFSNVIVHCNIFLCRIWKRANP